MPRRGHSFGTRGPPLRRDGGAIAGHQSPARCPSSRRHAVRCGCGPRWRAAAGGCQTPWCAKGVPRNRQSRRNAGCDHRRPPRRLHLLWPSLTTAHRLRQQPLPSPGARVRGAARWRRRPGPAGGTDRAAPGWQGRPGWERALGSQRGPDSAGEALLLNTEQFFQLLAHGFMVFGRQALQRLFQQGRSQVLVKRIVQGMDCRL